MSGEHFSGGKMPQEAIRFLPDELMSDVEGNVVYACTDVALRDQESGKIFLGMRQTEPQIGPWFIGGRNRYATGITANAAIQVKGDLHMDLPPARFKHISTYSTDFPVAAPGKEDHGRHTLNAVMCIDLNPEEVEELNRKVREGDIRDEYSSGSWYDPWEIAKPQTDFPFTLKQFVRDLYGHDVMMSALHDEANRENEIRGSLAREHTARQQLNEFRISNLTRLGFSEREATEIDRAGGNFAAQGIYWAINATRPLRSDDLRIHERTFGYTPTPISSEDLRTLVEKLETNEAIGDFTIMKTLREKGVARPNIISDNGPALRSTLRAAALALDYNEAHGGQLLDEISAGRNAGEYYGYWSNKVDQ